MSNVRELIQLSKQSSTITIEATVDTGFECLAEEEFRLKFTSDLPVCCDRGRIYFNIPVSNYPQVKTLRSVNNVRLVVDFVHDIDLHPEDSTDDVNINNLNVIGALANQIEWNKYLNFWKDVVNFEGVLYPSREEYLGAVAAISSECTAEENSPADSATFGELLENDQLINRSKRKSTLDNTSVVRYRVTCYRSGKHTFGSQDAARSFGGKLQDKFNWIVDLDEFHLEIILQLRDNDSIILICLTGKSMHKRNIAHYGMTTLRSTVAYNMLQLVKPAIGDVILDPMCGCGALPIEGAVGFDGTYHLCGDIDEHSVLLTNKNISCFEKTLLVDPINWNICSLPLRNDSVDIVATDMPFGKRVGSKTNNRTLYAAAFKELARVVKPTSGRMVLLTMDRTSYGMALRTTKEYWRQRRMMVIKMGGLKVATFLLSRTAQPYK